MMDVKDMAAIGLKNLRMISKEGKEVKELLLAPTLECKLSIPIDEDNKELMDLVEIAKEPRSFCFRISARKNGTMFEKCLYYQKSKKKRIRKKWEINRKTFGIKGGTIK